MYLYFGLNINDLGEFCKLVNEEENRGYEVNDEVFIDITDGLFITTYIAKLIHYVTAEGFVIIGFDDGLEKLKPNNRITLKSFKDQNKEIRLKVFDAASNINIRDNYKYTVGNSAIKSENDTKPDNKQTYYFTLTKDDHKCFVYRRYDGTLLIKTGMWNVDHTNFTLEDVPIEQVFPVSISSDLSIFRILDFDSRNFVVSKDSYNAYKKTIFSDNSDKIVEFFTDLDDCIRFTKTKKEEPKISNTKEPEVKPIDYMDYMSRVRPRSINDIWGPWTHKEQWKFDFKNYVPADAEATSKLYEERRMVIKDIKRNGPATIVFWLNGEKTVVQCRPGDQDDIEKGVIMAIVKGYCTKNKNIKNWTKIFDIPYADEVDVEKVIGLGVIKDLFGEKDHEWHYRQVLRWVYKIKGYAFEDEVKALLALGYSKDRIKKCLNTNLGAIRDALNPPKPKKKKTKNKVEENLNAEPELGTKPTPQYEVPIDGTPLFNNELLIKLPKEAMVNGDYIDHINLPDGRKLKFVVNDEQAKKIIEQSNLSEKIVNMFNNGVKISHIAKELNITEYFVKKALDEITKPKANPKKAERILKKATKEKKTHKTHVIHTEIEFPNYLEKEECEKILEKTKTKYADKPKINCMSELQKYFDRECKHYKINQLYGNGYSMYEIGRIIGVNAAAVQRMHNSDERKQ